MLGCRRMVVNDGGTEALTCCPMPSASGEFPGRDATADIADDSRSQDDIGKRNLKGKNGDERRRRYRPEHGVFERAQADAIGSEDHNGGYRRLDSIEDSRYRGHIAEGEINPGERDQDEERR